jgi:hypothetical protein
VTDQAQAFLLSSFFTGRFSYKKTTQLICLKSTVLKRAYLDDLTSIAQLICPCLLKVSSSGGCPRERRVPKHCMHHIRSSKSEARYRTNQLGKKTLVMFTETDHLSVHIVSTETYNCVSELVGTFESVGKSELQNAGKAGLVTVQGKISVVLGTVLISKIIGL